MKEPVTAESKQDAAEREIPVPASASTPDRQSLLAQIRNGFALKKLNSADINKPKKEENELIKILAQKDDMIERVQEKERLKAEANPIAEEDTSAGW